MIDPWKRLSWAAGGEEIVESRHSYVGPAALPYGISRDRRAPKRTGRGFRFLPHSPREVEEGRRALGGIKGSSSMKQ